MAAFYGMKKKGLDPVNPTALSPDLISPSTEHASSDAPPLAAACIVQSWRGNLKYDVDSGPPLDSVV